MLQGSISPSLLIHCSNSYIPLPPSILSTFPFPPRPWCIVEFNSKLINLCPLYIILPLYKLSGGCDTYSACVRIFFNIRTFLVYVRIFFNIRTFLAYVFNFFNIRTFLFVNASTPIYTLHTFFSLSMNLLQYTHVFSLFTYSLIYGPGIHIIPFSIPFGIDKFERNVGRFLIIKKKLGAFF